MFAIFLHESTNTFHYIVTSFPTAIYTIALVVCVLYWIIAVLGMVDIDFLDMDFDGDIDGTDSSAAQEGLAGLLSKFGLNGIPLTIVISLLTLTGWIFCYYAIYFGAKFLPENGLLIFAYKIIVLLASLIFCVFSTAQILKPLRKLFNTPEADETKHIIGQTITVRSSLVNNNSGEGILYHGGADILLNIRSEQGVEFLKGDEVVVIEQLNDLNLYRVISKTEFNGIDI